MKATVFLGGGRITSALVAGLRLAKYSQPIVVHDRHPKKLQQLKKQYGVLIEPDLTRAVEAADLLVIAVRPDSVRGLLKEIGKSVQLRTRPLTAVSLAAGIPLKKLQAGLARPLQWVRAMPSPASRSGRGLTALTFSRGFSLATRKNVLDLFSFVGPVLEISEREFDAFTVTYSTSHGYHALAALTQAAEGIGLSHKNARVAAAHALADGILALRESNLPLDHLLQEPATPGGIAAAVMSEMNCGGYQRVVTQGLRAGLKRARKNARG
ncbi:MAG: NAD(P)-binding domain-containing protein [Candidatus Sulfotelmatobacter sp.]